jgi:soluble lytic murein transglycosylase
MQRAMLLFSAGLRNEGMREWFWAIRGMNDQQLLATAEIALQRGVYDRAISAADQTENYHNFHYRYPLPHREIIQKNAKMANLEESWVYGLIRQESRFVNVARSSAGASGLMQLMPATARWTAKRIGMTDFSLAQVNDIDVNVRLGTAYLDYVLDRFDRQLPMGLAGYNAGPGRPNQWRAATALDGPAYIESIPFDETRDYVKKVLANIYFYEMVMGKTPLSLRVTSSTIAGR